MSRYKRCEEGDSAPSVGVTSINSQCAISHAGRQEDHMRLLCLRKPEHTPHVLPISDLTLPTSPCRKPSAVETFKITRTTIPRSWNRHFSTTWPCTSKTTRKPRPKPKQENVYRHSTRIIPRATTNRVLVHRLHQ